MSNLNDYLIKYPGNCKILFILFPPVWPLLPPLGLLSLSSFLLKNSIPSAILDLNLLAYERLKANWGKKWTITRDDENLKFIETLHNELLKENTNIQNLIQQINPEYIGFSLFSLNLVLSLRWIQKLKEYNPQRTFIAGGPEILYQYWKKENIEVKWPFLDYFIAGEGEYSLLNLIQKKSNDKFIMNKSKQYPDIFPNPFFLKNNNYPRKRAFPVMFSRGCVNRCEFCAECRLFPYYKHALPELFSDYLELLSNQKILWITFFDSLINGNYNALEDLCSSMAAKKNHLLWDAQIHIQPDMPLSLLKLMKQTGFFHGFVGLESGSAIVLKKMKKKYSPEDALIFFEKMKKAKIFFEISLIVDYPGETEKEFFETVDFIKHNKNLIPKIAQINPFIPLPGTPLEKIEKKDENVSKEKIKYILKTAKENQIPYTDSYILNLK